MQFEHSITINTTPEKIFAIYSDVAAWSKWDLEVESASMNGPFVLHGTGTVKPKDVSQTKITITELTPNQSVTTSCKLPLCTMHFIHEMNAENAQNTRVVNKVLFTGLLAPLFGRLIGKGITKTMPSTLLSLKHYAEV